MIEVARLLDGGDGSRLALYDDVDAHGAIARGDLVLAMQLLQAATSIQRLDFRSRCIAFYGQPLPVPGLTGRESFPRRVPRKRVCRSLVVACYQRGGKNPSHAPPDGGRH